MNTDTRTRDRDYTPPPTVLAERRVERGRSKGFMVLNSLDTFLGQIASVVPPEGLQGRSGTYTADQLEGQASQAMPKLRETLKAANPTELADETVRQAIALRLLNNEAQGVTAADGLRAALVETAINERLGNRAERSISDTVVMRREPREQRERRLQPFVQANSMMEVLSAVKKLYQAGEVIYAADDTPLTQEQVNGRLLDVVRVLDTNFRSAQLGQQLPEAEVNNLLSGTADRQGRVQQTDVPTDLGLRENVARIITTTYRLHPVPKEVLLSPARMQAERAQRQNLGVPGAEPSRPERPRQVRSELVVHYPERPVVPASAAEEPTPEVPRHEVIKLQAAIDQYIKGYLTNALHGPQAFSRDGILTTGQAMIVSNELRNKLDETYVNYFDELRDYYQAATLELNLQPFKLRIQDKPTATQAGVGRWLAAAADVVSPKWGEASERALNLRPREVTYTVSFDATEKAFSVTANK